jgi:hypothetical protein
VNLLGGHALGLDDGAHVVLPRHLCNIFASHLALFNLNAHS